MLSDFQVCNHNSSMFRYLNLQNNIETKGLVLSTEIQLQHDLCVQETLCGHYELISNSGSSTVLLMSYP